MVMAPSLVKWTEMLQDCPAPKLVGQLFVWEDPVTVMLEMFSGVVPVLVSVVIPLVKHVQCPIGSGMQPKFRLVGLSSTTVPVPLREMVCGLPGASSATESVPVKLSLAVGEKVASMVQLAPEARFEPQSFVSAKLEFVAMLDMLSGAVP
jgi:hypothetical protein